MRTKTEILLAHIRSLGNDRAMNPIGIRTSALFEATGVPAKSIQQLLESHVKSGELYVCKITGPSGQQEREYRVGGGVPAPDFVPLKTQPGFPWPTAARAKVETAAPAVALSKPKPAGDVIEPPVFLKPAPPSAVKAAAGDALRCGIDDDGTVRITTDESVIELNIDQVLRLGDFLRATEGVWRP